MTRFVEEIETRQPREEEAAFLGLTDAQHVLEVTRIAYTKDDMPVETVINVFPKPEMAALLRMDSGVRELP